MDTGSAIFRMSLLGIITLVAMLLLFKLNPPRMNENDLAVEYYSDLQNDSTISIDGPSAKTDYSEQLNISDEVELYTDDDTNTILSIYFAFLIIAVMLFIYFYFLG